jgi:hypothetical protein
MTWDWRSSELDRPQSLHHHCLICRCQFLYHRLIHLRRQRFRRHPKVDRTLSALALASTWPPAPRSYLEVAAVEPGDIPDRGAGKALVEELGGGGGREAGEHKALLWQHVEGPTRSRFKARKCLLGALQLWPLLESGVPASDVVASAASADYGGGGGWW